MRALYEWILEQGVLGSLIYVVLLLGGVFAIAGMPVEEYPNVSFDQVAIATAWPGASAEDVERLVTVKIEDEIEDVKGIDFISSTSVEGLSRILVKFEDDIRDFERGFRDLESEVRRVRDLPPDAETPEIEKIDVEAVNPVVFVVIYGDAHERVRRATAEELERRLEGLPGVRRCNTFGVRDHEVHVEADPERLAGHGLTIGDLAGALAARNVAAPAGVLRGGGAEVVVRTASDWSSPSEIASAPVRALPGGGTLRVSDVARVAPGFEDAAILARFQGRPSSSLAIVKGSDANALDVRDAVGEAVARFRADGLTPPGLDLGFFGDTTIRIRDRVSVLASNVWQGTALVFVLLGLFIGFRMAALATIGIGFSFFGTFIGLHALGESVNVLSLFGLVLVSGILVDDAIVVIENISRHHEDGKDMRTAALDGIVEVAGPIMSSILTGIASFLPLLLMSGVTGKFFSVIPTAVVVALLFSLFEALTILPIHVYKMGTDLHAGAAGGEGRFAGVVRLYRRVLAVTTRRRYVTVLVTALIAGAAFLSLRSVKVMFFPSDYQYLFVNAKLPPDASLAETDETLGRIDRAVLSLGRDVIESSLATPGFYYDFNYTPHVNAHYGQLFVTLARREGRRVDTKGAMAAIRRRLEREDVGRADVEVMELNDGPPIGRPVSVRVQSEDLSILRRLAREVEEVVAGVPGVLDVRSNLEVGKSEALARLDEERAAATGVSAAGVAAALAEANDGRVATRLKAGDEEWDVRVRADERSRRTVADLGAVRVRTAAGALVPVAQVARLEQRTGLASIARYDRRRTITVTGDVDPAVTTSLAANGEIARRLEPLLDREPGLSVAFGGEFEETNRSFASLGKAFLIAVVAIYAILGAQFRSYLQPLLILLSVPFALVGVIVGLHVTGDPFTVATGLGVVGLVGVAVNDGIVLIDFANERRRAGLSPEAAILDAAPTRLRAIFLTSITTIAGMLPAAIGIGGRSVVWGPMASALCFGFVVQWALTMLVTPAIFLIAEDASAALARFGRSR